MYGVEFDTTPEMLDKDFVLPIGKAKVRTVGSGREFLRGNRPGWQIKGSECSLGM